MLSSCSRARWAALLLALPLTIGLTATAHAQAPRTITVAADTQRASTPSISANGRYVAYQSGITQTGTATGAPAQVMLWDRATRTTRIVSAVGGVPATAASYSPRISSDGRYVAYVTQAPEVAAGASAEAPRVVLWDRRTDTTTAVSPVLTPPAGSHVVMGPPRPSKHGEYVAFGTDAALVASDVDEDNDAYLWSRATGSLRMIPDRGNAFVTPRDISDDGRIVVLGTERYDDSEAEDVVVWDRRTGSRRLIARDSSAVLSGDGRFVAYSTGRYTQGRLVTRVAVLDRVTGRRSTVAVPRRFAGYVWESARPSAISRTGRFVTVLTHAPRRPDQLLLVDRRTHGVSLVSHTPEGTLDRAGVTASGVSADAGAVVFSDRATPYAGPGSCCSEEGAVYLRRR